MMTSSLVDSLMDVGVAVSLLNSAECFALIRTLLNEATAILSKPHKVKKKKNEKEAPFEREIGS